MRALPTTLLAVCCLAFAGCGDDGGEPARSAAQGQTQATAGEPPAPGCRPADEPAPKAEGDLSAPRERLDRDRTHRVVLETNCGEITIELDAERSPETAASFASLVREGFYDGLTFHRISAGFVIQGGDPTGEGSGGPGYSVVEPPRGQARYRAGVVAMAKTGTEEPGTSGSQFFIVTAPDAGLPPDYAIAGRVVDGMDAVERIAEVEADPATERPLRPVVITDARLESA